LKKYTIHNPEMAAPFIHKSEKSVLSKKWEPHP